MFNQAYDMASAEAKRNQKKEFGMDEIAPQLEKILQPVLMTMDLSNEVEYEKLSHWAKNHSWEEKTESTKSQETLYKCITIQGMIDNLLPLMKDEQRIQKTIGNITPINKNSPDFNTVISVIDKTGGVNPGFHMTILQKNAIPQTYTLKHAKTGNTIAEYFTAFVNRHMIGIEDSLPNKEQVKTKNILPSKKVIAPAYLIFRNDDIKSASPKNFCKQLWVASEWSQDAFSFEACKLFGFTKRMYFAGTFKRDLFENLQMLNLHCNLGLENVVIAATYSCDFDLHLENFRLNFNNAFVSKTHAAEARNLFAEFQDLITFRCLQIKKDGSAERKGTEKHFLTLVHLIESLKKLGVKVYFHKIDHDNGFFRYSDSKRVVDFSSHYSSPFYFKDFFEVCMQPTLHITELTGTTGAGLDKLFLSNQAMVILRANPLKIYIQIILKALNELFEDLTLACNRQSHLSNDQKLEMLHGYLLKFHEHITGSSNVSLNNVLNCPGYETASLKDKIEIIKKSLMTELHYGCLLKINDLQGQLYQRLLVKESKNEITSKQRTFKEFLHQQLTQNQAYYFFFQWPNILNNYNDGEPKGLTTFSVVKSEETLRLIQYMDKQYKIFNKYQKNHEKNVVWRILSIKSYQHMQDYLSSYKNGKTGSDRRLGTLILNSMKTFCFLPVTRPAKQIREQCSIGDFTLNMCMSRRK
jgi:hypothetical protein